ncbi:unnamed protein product [Trifolium pratense]|uniref:Uncharacterized protein n=1 Tax=Trifolium pratense TaxID=57577 RepID=A0ACB0L8N8_TRIPR|nr:unnamed protein product [Trifolium pratense]
MEPNEKVSEYFNRITQLSNAMESCGEVVTDHNIVSKIMCTLSYKFDTISVAIPESKDLSTMNVEELQCSLEAYDQSVNERSKDRGIDQALQAQTFKKNGGNKWKGKNKYENGNSQNDSNNKAGKKFQDSTNNEESKANMAKNDSGSEQDPLLMMATTNDDLDKQEGWYLDTCCSNHMTGHRDWLVNYDSSRNSTIRFADSRTIKSEGIGDVLIKGKNGDQALITGVLYVPNMQSNLLSMGQLVEKGFTMTLGNNQMKVYNVENKLKIN